MSRNREKDSERQCVREREREREMKYRRVSTVRYHRTLQSFATRNSTYWYTYILDTVAAGVS